MLSAVFAFLAGVFVVSFVGYSVDTLGLRTGGLGYLLAAAGVGAAAAGAGAAGAGVPGTGVPGVVVAAQTTGTPRPNIRVRVARETMEADRNEIGRRNAFIV